MIPTDRELTQEVAQLQARIKEVRQARIDELWPTYYEAQITLARNSMEAMTKIQEIARVQEVVDIATAEIASLIIFILELESENDGTDIVINSEKTPCG